MNWLKISIEPTGDIGLVSKTYKELQTHMGKRFEQPLHERRYLNGK